MNLSEDKTSSELPRRLRLLLAAMAVLLGCGSGVDSATQLRLEQAVDAGDTAGVRAALDAGADPNRWVEGNLPPIALAAISYLGKDPALKSKIGEGTRVEMAELLIAAGAELDPRCDGPNIICKPLPHAAEGGFAELVRLLLSAGADPNSRNPYGLVPLMYALGNKQLETAQILLEHGADPNLRNQSGMSSFDGACAMGEVEFVALALKHGADLEARGTYADYESVTPLMLAAAEGQLEVVKLLLEAGANPSAKATPPATALSLAREQGQENVVAFLERSP